MQNYHNLTWCLPTDMGPTGIPPHDALQDAASTLPSHLLPDPGNQPGLKGSALHSAKDVIITSSWGGCMVTPAAGATPVALLEPASLSERDVHQSLVA